MKYKTIDDWLYENEGFMLRIERVPPEALEWIKVAWELGRKSAEEDKGDDEGI
jgi:hypothetical protein